MKRITTFLLGGLVLLALAGCDLGAVANGLQSMGNGLMGTAASYGAGASYGGRVSTVVPTSSSSREWHNCSSCSGSGKCKYCHGSGRSGSTHDGKCHACARTGTGRCAGCDGKGGWYI